MAVPILKKRALFSQNYYRKNTVSKESRRFSSLKPVFSLIEERYNENLSLTTLARCANLNPSYFCRYFKEFTDRTPMDYLNYYRIEVALRAVTQIKRSQRSPIAAVSMIPATLSKFSGTIRHDSHGIL